MNVYHGKSLCPINCEICIAIGFVSPNHNIVRKHFMRRPLFRGTHLASKPLFVHSEMTFFDQSVGSMWL